MILIVGGSGTLGSFVARRLLDAGQSVRVMSRTPAKAAALRAAGAEVVAGDLLDRDSLVRACSGADALVAAAHSFLGRGRNASIHVDGTGHRQLIDVAKASGVRHVVYTSAYLPAPAYRSIPFFRIKNQIEEYLKASGLSFTIVRPTAFMDFHAHVLIGKPILENKKVMLFGRGERPRNFIAADDVAQLVTWALHDTSAYGKTVDIGGPEDLTHMDIVRVYESTSGRKATVRHMPIAVPRLLAPLIRSLHPGLSQILQAAVLADTAEQRFDSRRPPPSPIKLTRLADWVSQHVNRQNETHAVPTIAT